MLSQHAVAASCILSARILSTGSDTSTCSCRATHSFCHVHANSTCHVRPHAVNVSGNATVSSQVPEHTLLPQGAILIEGEPQDLIAVGGTIVVEGFADVQVPGGRYSG
jgi:hypothetical protein